jgi:transcriptional antiterminator RfaH
MEQSDNSTKWYVINTNPRCEDLVYYVLKRESFEVFLPKIDKKFKKEKEPLFPGYLFVRFNPRLSNWVKIKYLQGVRKILGYGNTPTPVPETIIKAVIERVSRGCFFEKLPFKAGDRVRFMRGPFAGLEGKFTGELSGKERVKVLLEAINWAFKVEVEASELSKVG